MRRDRAGLVLPLLLAAVLTGCAADASSGDGDRPTELTVFAAASLRDALAAAATEYEDASAAVAITVSTDSSAALATQIEQGAPADVFLSADTANPQRLVDAGLVAGAPVTFASNELTVIVPADNPAGISSAADLARPGVKVVAAGAAVPITRYATQLVGNLATEPGYPGGFAAAYQRNIVSREDNVRAVVAKIELGEGDAGIVYATDAAASSVVATVEPPADANVRASYAGVVVASSTKPAAARAFLEWIAGPDGRAVLGRFGFGPPTAP